MCTGANTVLQLQCDYVYNASVLKSPLSRIIGVAGGGLLLRAAPFFCSRGYRFVDYAASKDCQERVLSCCS